MSTAAPLPAVPARDPAEVDWIEVRTKTPQPYPAVIPAHVLTQLRADLATAQAAAAHWQSEAEQWRQKVMDARELLNLVAELTDDPTPATLAAVTNHYSMWRACVEAGVPVTWALAAPEPGGDGAEDDCPWA